MKLKKNPFLMIKASFSLLIFNYFFRNLILISNHEHEK